MILKEIVEKLDLKPLATTDIERVVTNGLCTDLLSLIISNTDRGTIWITHQGHVNVVAVSLLAELAAVIVIGDVEQATINAAKEKGLNLFTSNDCAFNLVGKLYSNGITGKDENL